MEYKITVVRRKSPDESSYEQTFSYETDNIADTVASALISIGEVSWECSCLQKKCGACAMIINGRPRLACDSRLSEVAADFCIRLEPLHKFPVVRDLICDRSILQENLKAIAAWIEEGDEVKLKEDKKGLLFEAGKCLQCGCCLEVCPNFAAGGDFFGASAMMPAAGLLEKLDSKQSKALRRQYSSRFFAGCGKSLACRDICPAGLDVESLMVNSNAILLWKHLLK